MTASYSAILLLHLSDSRAKLRRAAYLFLTPVGEVMTASAPAPAWHHAPSQWMVHTFSVVVSGCVIGPVQSTMKSARTCDLMAVLGSKVIW
jgi:predicted tellurium resistance membrane protein TerC